MTGLRAALVSVDYSDCLQITLPYNRHHFSSMLVVTSPQDYKTQALALGNGCAVHVTDAFYKDGAHFNKWLALEEGLTAFGRNHYEGWWCLMDADVLWPKWVSTSPTEGVLWRYLQPGYLYGPLRRMCPVIPQDASHIPPESTWGRYPVHRNLTEWAGYTQIFHSSDPVLGQPPWHQTDWLHAGGADSFFQAKWDSSRKVRLPFEVLHLGHPGTNWCGRVSSYADGTIPEQASTKASALQAYMRERRSRRGSSTMYDHERVKRPRHTSSDPDTVS